MAKTNSQSGQILLIMLLVMSVAMTVVLSLIGRGTTDTTITSQLEESARAFAAAEAGIESALKSGVGTGSPQILSPGVTYNVGVTNIGGTTDPFVFPQKTKKGDTETVWLVDHVGGAPNITPLYRSSSIDLCWSAATTIPAILATIVYLESSDNSYRVLKGAYDPDGTRIGTNKFTTPTSTGAGCTANTNYRQTLDFTALSSGTVDPNADTLIMLRVQPIYSDTLIAVAPVGLSAIPAQGNRVEATGAVGSGVTRKIVVYRQYSAPLGIFDAALYSQSGITR